MSRYVGICPGENPPCFQTPEVGISERLTERETG